MARITTFFQSLSPTIPKRKIVSFQFLCSFLNIRRRDPSASHAIYRFLGRFLVGFSNPSPHPPSYKPQSTPLPFSNCAKGTDKARLSNNHLYSKEKAAQSLETGPILQRLRKIKGLVLQDKGVGGVLCVGGWGERRRKALFKTTTKSLNHSAGRVREIA